MIRVQVQFLFDLGLWMAYCEASGTNEWVRNEGQLDDNEMVTVPEAMYVEFGHALARVGFGEGRKAS